MSNELVLRITSDPQLFREGLLAWLPDAPADEVVNTRNQLVDVAGYVKRHSKQAWAETLRAARLTEWEMAQRWPAGADTSNRTDDRPLLNALNSGANVVLWQYVYQVGRVDRDILLNESEPNLLSQAAVMKLVAPPRQRYGGIRQGDAREQLSDIDDNSVDLILTDPPYGDEARHLYDWLGGFAARTLKPGGSLVVLTGQSRLPDDIARLSHPDLRYWWTFAFLHGASQRLPGIFVMVGWKPMLWFVKGHRDGRTMIGDVLRGKAYDKDGHQWAQGDGVQPIIEQLCPDDGLIVDPFAGTGAWGEMAAALGRRWIGSDVGGAVIV